MQAVDNTALVADSEEKLCRLVSEFGRVFKRRTLRDNGKPLEEMDYFTMLIRVVSNRGLRINANVSIRSSCCLYETDI